MEIDHEIFSTVILPSADSRRAVVSFCERMCTILVNCLEDKACPVNLWLGELTALDITPMSPREREKRDRRISRGDEKEGQERKRNWNESEETEEVKIFPLYPYLLQG